MTSSVRSEDFFAFVLFISETLSQTFFLLQIGGLNLRRRTAMREAVFALRLHSAIGMRTDTISISRLRSRGTRAQLATARFSHCVCHHLCSYSLLFNIFCFPSVLIF